MASILLLIDKKSETSELIELFLGDSEHRYQVIEVTDDTKVSCEIVQQSLAFHILLVYITSSGSPLWSFAQQIRETQDGKSIPIVALLVFADSVVGPNYMVWRQYHRMLTDFLSIPFTPEELMVTLDKALDSGAAI